jgi:ArsR family transcriptional regulator
MATASKTFDMELLFRALADRTRLRLLNLMGNDEICVCYFVEVLKTPQPKISRHLAYLRKAGIVGARREGKWMHYRIVEPGDQHAAEVVKNIQEWLASDYEMQRDRSRLIQTCCVKVPAHLMNAPKPPLVIAESQTRAVLTADRPAALTT